MERMSDILAKTISQRARAQRNEQAARRTPARDLSTDAGQPGQQSGAADPAAPPTARQSVPPRALAPRSPASSVSASAPSARGGTRGSTSAGQPTSSPTSSPASRPMASQSSRPLRAVSSAGRALSPADVPARPTRMPADAHEAPAGSPGADEEMGEHPADRVLELPPRRTALTRARTSGPLRQAPEPPTAPEAQRRVEARPDTSRLTPTPGATTRPSRPAPSRATSAASSSPSLATSGSMTPLRELAADYEARLARTAGRVTRPLGSAGILPTDGDATSEDDGDLEPSLLALSPAERLDVTAPDVCPICHGAGYVRIDVPIGDPSFGQAVPCACKERAREERRRSELNQLSSLAPFSNKTFETFDARVPGVREAFDAAKQFIEGLHADDGPRWLVLAGSYGTGKTHLAAAIANEQLARGTPVFFSAVPDLLDHLRSAFAPSSELTYDALFDRIREVELLVLDDLGAENSTAWATEKLFQLLNYRYNFRMPTVFTTNHKLLAHLDERIRSRLSDLSLVRHVAVEAADFRERHAGRAQRTGRAQPGTTSHPGNGGHGGSAHSGGHSGGAGGMGGSLPPRGRGYWQ